MDDPVSTPPPPEPTPEPPQMNLARVQAVPWLIVIGLIALAAWLGMKAFGESDVGDPVAATLTAFEKQNKLTVFSAELAPVVSAEDSRLLGLVNSRQVAVIPARVDYTLDLSEMDASRLEWDADKKVLTVRLPPLKASKPNLDEARAQYLREGVWISRDAQDSLSRKNTQAAEKLALEQAVNPVLTGLARSAARDAVRQNLAIPLEAAGVKDVTVEVLLDGEAPAS
ncbi:MAG: DUF4230 domain-containing protein [Novosphingobium sp.]|nr:DUF4230 domain-containing protein [Novosphingobium sp.]